MLVTLFMCHPVYPRELLTGSYNEEFLLADIIRESIGDKPRAHGRETRLCGKE